jgi:hypothetical protein
MAITLSGNGITEDELAVSNTVTALADAAATLTAAQLRGGLFTITPTTPRILTTDTAANIVAAIPNTADGVSFEFTVVNLAGFDVTFAGGTGVTINGKTIVANGSATFRVVRLSATTVGLYRAEGGLNGSAAKMGNANTQTITTSTTVILDYDTVVYDNLSEFDTAGRFTAKSSGEYIVNASLLTGSYAWAAGGECRLILYKNGVLESYGIIDYHDAAFARRKALEINKTVKLGIGDYIDIRVLHNLGSDMATLNATSYNHMSVHRIA